MRKQKHSVVVDSMASIMGQIVVIATAQGIVQVSWEVDDVALTQYDIRYECIESPLERQIALLHVENCKNQLAAYFAGDLYNFNLPFVISGTSFQESVWRALLTIPYGETVSYQDIAVRIGRPRAVRAVGQANRANQLPIVIPCHRVIGKQGDLVGYAGQQTHLKEILLAHERSVSRGVS